MGAVRLSTRMKSEGCAVLCEGKGTHARLLWREDVDELGVSRADPARGSRQTAGMFVPPAKRIASSVALRLTGPPGDVMLRMTCVVRGTAIARLAMYASLSEKLPVGPDI